MPRKRLATPAQLAALTKARRVRRQGLVRKRGVTLNVATGRKRRGRGTYKQIRAAAHARSVKRKRQRGGRRRRGRGIGDWVRKGINFGRRVYSKARSIYDPLSESKLLSNTAGTLASVGLPGAALAQQGLKYIGLGKGRRRRRGGARVALNVGLLPR